MSISNTKSVKNGLDNTKSFLEKIMSNPLHEYAPERPLYNEDYYEEQDDWVRWLEGELDDLDFEFDGDFV